MRILAATIMIIIGLAVLYVNINLTSGASANATNYHKTMRAQ